MQMERGLDTGPVYSRVTTIRIEPTDTGGRLHDRLAALGAELLKRDVDRILERFAAAGAATGCMGSRMRHL